MTRVLLYTRVSTERQAEKYGLDAQLAGLHKRAADLGYELVCDGEQSAFVDDGYSGGDLNRPALDRLRQAVSQGRAEVVLCYDPDRLSRNLTDLLLLDDEIARAGLRLEFITQDTDSSPEGRLFFTIRGAVAEFEKAKIRERMVRGKREKARQGKVVNPNRLPTWLRSDDGGATVVLDPRWAEAARLVWRLFLDEGLTLRKVAERLTLLGYPTPSGGSHWQPTVIQGWLRNPAARGEFCQFRFKTCQPKVRRKPVLATARRRPETSQVERPADEWSRIPVPAIVDSATWEAAQERLDRNRALARRNAQRVYLLSGLCVCGACGRRMVGVHKNRTGLRYYQCGHRGGATRVDGTGACRAPYSNASQLEAVVWEQISSLLRDPDLLETELARRRESGSPTRAGLEAELVRVKTRLAAIPSEVDRLVEGFSKGVLPEEPLRRRLAALQEERQEFTRHAGQLEAELSRLDRDALAETGALEFARTVAMGLGSLGDQGRQELLRLVVREVVVSGERIVIRTVLPTEDLDGGPSDGSGILRTPAPLLAGPAADPGGREPHPRHLAQPPQRAGAHASRDLDHRPRHSCATLYSHLGPASPPQ